MSAELAQLYIDAEAARFERLTHRQFTQVTEDRFFDGSGTGLMVLDEFTDINTVELYLNPGLGYGQINLDYIQQVSVAGYPKDRIQIVQGPPAQPVAWLNRFPQGRSNVLVNADWGFGTSIPKDVWLAVLRQSAADIMAANTLSSLGQLVDWQDDDVREKYEGSLPGETAGWVKGFDMAVDLYRRPITAHRRRRRVEYV